MKWMSVALGLIALVMSAPCLAENKSNPKASIGISPGELAPTQEMWFYEQYQKQYTDPKTVVRQQAEFRSADRMRRIAALRWFGFSNQRPTAGVDWIHAENAPRWASNNVNLPYLWNGPATTTLLVRPSATSLRGY